MELADTSAWTNRHKDSTVEADFDSRVLADEIATCPVVAMELLWTAQTPSEVHELREELEALPQVDINGAAWKRALEVWEALSQQGRHRQVKWVDLIVAATAEVAGIPVCHYDRDFEVIAGVTRQAERAIAPIGTLGNR